MTAIFWMSALLLFYTYLGYPLYLFARSSLFDRRVKKDMAFRPAVSVIISAHNEEAHIGQKVQNLLESDYPQDKIEVLVGSDGSTDKTNDILSGIPDKRVRAFFFAGRRGKPSVLNDLVPNAHGKLLVFCDTRQLFDSEAISHLAANFADEKVGCVSGELVFEENAASNGISDGVGIYWDYEKMIRKGESAVDSMVGATGAIYAIRKKLYTPPPADTILDDVFIPLAIARRGYRCIWDDKAKAYDRPAYTPREEYRRKVRTLAGNYQIFAAFRDLLVPFRKPVSFPLVSHKLMRVLAPFFMIMLLASNVCLAGEALYSFFLICQTIFYIFAIFGSFTYKRKAGRFITKAASAAYMFCLMNFTAVVGLWRFLSGTQRIVWEK